MRITKIERWRLLGGIEKLSEPGVFSIVHSILFSTAKHHDKPAIRDYNISKGWLQITIKYEPFMFEHVR